MFRCLSFLTHLCFCLAARISAVINTPTAIPTGPPAGMFVFDKIEVLALMNFVLSSGAHVYGEDVEKHRSCLEVLSCQISGVEPRFLPFKPVEQAAHVRDLQSLFDQSVVAMWRQIKFAGGWANMCQVEDLSSRVFRAIYPNIEIFVQSQISENALHIKEAQKTAMTSPFCIHSGVGSRHLQFVIGGGTSEETRYENLVTDNGRNCIFKVLYDDLCSSER